MSAIHARGASPRCSVSSCSATPGAVPAPAANADKAYANRMLRDIAAKKRRCAAALERRTRATCPHLLQGSFAEQSREDYGGERQPIGLSLDHTRRLAGTRAQRRELGCRVRIGARQLLLDVTFDHVCMPPPPSAWKEMVMAAISERI